ncbi:MAG TPA: universal stress protein [Gemmataceae bacterium]|nr:universal stress protein [Gemmataceae bacterium]
MNHEHRSNWTRHHGGRPPPAVSDRWEQNGLATDRASSAFGENPTVQRTPEEVGLTLTPPPRYRSILVPVDGEPFGEHALPLALGIARRAGADVRVVHVHCPLQSTFQPDRLYPDSGLDAFLRRRQQAYLAGLFRRLRKVTSVPVTPVFLQGREVADSLCEAAGAGTDLVVMATHGRGPLGRFWFGSVADMLLRRLSVPLLFVRGYNAPADLTGDPLVRHVLVPLDGSAFAEQVLEPALALGTLTGADHTLLRVIPMATDYSLGYPAAGSQRPLADRQQAEAWEYLRRTTDRLGGRTLRIHPRIVHDEQPVAEAILHYAQTHDADLIALATRGRGGLARLFQGSVADRVVRGASVPVLVFRPDSEQEGRAIP